MYQLGICVNSEHKMCLIKSEKSIQPVVGANTCLILRSNNLKMKKQIIIILSAALFLVGCQSHHNSFKKEEFVNYYNMPDEAKERLRISIANKNKPKKVVYKGENGDITVIEYHLPYYPRRAKLDGLEGRVVISFMVDEKGIPVNIQVTESAGEQFDKAALRAVSKWRILPAVDGKKALMKKFQVPFEFELEKKEN